MVSPYSAARHTTYRPDVAAPVRYFASEEVGMAGLKIMVEFWI